jgi:quinol monooxygenase YgiN
MLGGIGIVNVGFATRRSGLRSLISVGKEIISMVKFALFARLRAKPEKADEVANFLQSAVALANAEAGTIHWFALRFGPTTFGVFDTFAAESGRKAHLEGPIAQALAAKGGELFSEPPSIERIDLIGAKV